MQQVAYCLNIQQQFTPVYHPQANPVERKNRDMKVQLSILVQSHHASWSSHLSAVRFAMNTSKCQTTGFTSAYLTFGRELRTVDDVDRDLRTIVENETFITQITPYLRDMANIFKDAKEAEYRQQDSNKKAYDLSHRPQLNLDVGALVLVNTHVLSNASKGLTSKFVPKRDGPYIITKKVGSTAYEVASPTNPTMPLGTYHSSAITPYRRANNVQSEPLHPMKKRGRPKKS